jgi:uncharacterized protein YaaN involved in tellurite resistance
MTQTRSIQPLQNTPNDLESKLPPVQISPRLPQGMSEAELEDLKMRARTIACDLRDAAGSNEMEIVDSVANLGMQAQRRAASDLALLKGRVGDAFSRDGAADRVSRDLVELRTSLRQIAPAESARQRWITGVLRFLPFRRNFVRLLETIAVRYEPVSRQVVVIENKLREGRMMLHRDNIELRKLYEQAESQKPEIQKNAFLGELLMQELEELVRQTPEPQKKETLESALYDLAMRVQDLRTIDEVYTQFFVGIEMTRRNNTRLAQAVERTMTLASSVILVGLAIQIALARQKKVLEATQRTREFLGNMVVANAEAIRQHTEEIGDVYKEPVIAVEKISRAHDALLEAIDRADRLRQEGIASARENIARLGELSAVFEARVRGIKKMTELRSVEASAD